MVFRSILFGAGFIILVVGAIVVYREADLGFLNKTLTLGANHLRVSEARNAEKLLLGDCMQYLKVAKNSTLIGQGAAVQALANIQMYKICKELR